MYCVLGIEPQSLPRSEINFINFVHEADRTKVERAVAIARSAKTTNPREVRIVRRDGETRTIYMDNELVRGARDRPLLVTVFKDVTEQRWAAEHHRKMEQKLLHGP